MTDTRFAKSSTFDSLCNIINQLSTNDVMLFVGTSGDVTSALTNGANSTACRGIISKMGADNYFDYFLFVPNGNAAYYGRYNNGAYENLVQFTTTRISTS